MPGLRRVNIGREIWWVLSLIAFIVFVSTTYVTTYLGARGRGRAKVWAIWRDLTTDLPGGGSDAVKVSYLLILVIFLVGSFVGLWVTLGTDRAVDAMTTPRPLQHPPEML